MTDIKYVLITPARNEERLIGKVLESVVSQTIAPRKWIIVDDGSTDRTAEIVKGYEGRYDFIELMSNAGSEQRSFTSKASAVNGAYERLSGLEFDFIGNVDADLSFPPDYMERLLGEIERDPRIGVGSGIYVEEVNGRLVHPATSLNHVPGATQLFRRRCFEQIGRYASTRAGGMDTVANIKARMLGWETRQFPHLQTLHHRHTGTGGGASLLRARYREGWQDYHLGTHALFAMLKALRRVGEHPMLVGAAARAAGFFITWLRRQPRQVSEEFVRFIQREQLGRLRALASGGRKKAKLSA